MWTYHPQKNSNNNNLGRSGRGLIIPLLSLRLQSVEILVGAFSFSGHGSKLRSGEGSRLKFSKGLEGMNTAKPEINHDTLGVAREDISLWSYICRRITLRASSETSVRVKG